MVCTFTSLLPLTTNDAPIFSFSFAATLLIALFCFSFKAGAETLPPKAAYKARVIAPVSEGRWVILSSALAPVVLK